MLEQKPLRALRIGDVENRTGLKKSSIYLLESKGRFPKRVKLTERTTTWLEHEVNAWITERAAARSSAA